MVTPKGRATRDRIVAAAATLMIRPRGRRHQHRRRPGRRGCQRIADLSLLRRQTVPYPRRHRVPDRHHCRDPRNPAGPPRRLDALRAWAELSSRFSGMAVTAAAAHWARWPANSPKATPMRAKTWQRATGAGKGDPRRPRRHGGPWRVPTRHRYRQAGDSTADHPAGRPSAHQDTARRRTAETALNTMIDHIESFTTAKPQ